MHIDHGIRKDLERTLTLLYMLFHWDKLSKDIQKQELFGNK